VVGADIIKEKRR